MRSWPDLDATPFPRTYRVLFLLLPADFRAAHGESLACMLRDRHQDAGADRWTCLWQEGGDLARTAVGLRVLPRKWSTRQARRRFRLRAPSGSFAFDLKLAWRALRRAPGFTAITLFILTVGIGANAAVFSLLDAALFRPLPYPDADRLAMLHVTFRNPGEPAGMWSWSYPKLQSFRRSNHTFASMGAVAHRTYNLTGIPVPVRLDVEVVSAAYFTTLGVEAVRGRTFAPDEDSIPGAHPVVMVSHAEWQTRYGADPALIGSAIELDGHTMTVVGIVPPTFQGITGPTDLWVPLMMARCWNTPKPSTKQAITGCRSWPAWTRG